MADEKNAQSERKDFKNGDHLSINGVEYEVVNGKLSKVASDPVKEEPSFKLVFKKYGGFGFRKDFSNEILDKVRISEDNKTCTVDIYPLLEYLFGKERVNLKDFAGCEYEIPGTIGDRKVAFGSLEFMKIEDSINELIDSVFTNSKQSNSMRNLIKKTLQDPFVDFGHLLW